jgi:hypothetical protein
MKINEAPCIMYIDRWPSVAFLFHARENVVREQVRIMLQEESLRTDVREEKTDSPGGHQCNKGPRKERTCGRIFSKTVELEVAKRAIEFSIVLRKVSDWTLWRDRPPPKKEKTTSSSFFSPLVLQPQFGPWPTSTKLSVSLRFSRS